MSDQTSAPGQAPRLQGLDLFEQYEASGHLLVVTSDRSELGLSPGDFIVRRRWSTAAEPVEVRRAALPVDGRTDPCPARGYQMHFAVGAGAIRSPYTCHGCGALFTLPETKESSDD